MNYRVAGSTGFIYKKLKNNVLPVCFLCDEVPENGIRSGFFIRGIFICSSCENKLINSSPEREDEYLKTINKLREILFKKNRPR